MGENIWFAFNNRFSTVQVEIFTLIAVAALATSANAQETLIFENGATVIDNQEFTTASTKLQLGNDIKKAEGWDVKASSHNDYLAPFSQTVIEDDQEKSRIVYVAGGNNPKDDVANKGGGYNGAGDEGKLPQSGTYYVITTSQAGSILAGIVLNGDKEFFVIDGTDAVKTEVPDKDPVQYTYNVINADAVFTHDQLTFTDGDGNELPWSDEVGVSGYIFDGGKGGIKVQDKITGTVEFSVKANHTYYVFCTGSKLGFFGYIFTPGEDTNAIHEVSGNTVANGVIYNLAGQQVSKAFKGVVIQNGKKFIQK